MNTYQRLLQQYRSAVTEYDEEPWKHAPFPKYEKMIIEPLGEKLAARYSSTVSYISVVMGPSGLGARTTIALYRQDTHERWEKYHRDRHGAKARLLGNALQYGAHHITFECTGEQKRRLLVVDYSVTMRSFPPGTIGYLNGFNHPTKPVPLAANLDWFTDWINNQERENNAR